jgi:hypothetical protein
MLGLRVTPTIKQRLDAAAKSNGRSQAQEAEFRLEQTFLIEDMLKARLISMRVPAGSHPGEDGS